MTSVAAAVLEAPAIDPATTVDDQTLVTEALAGRGEAFGSLVERYDRAVYHLAYRTLRDSEEARDVAQEAFFKAYRSLRTFRPGAKFSTWIFSIAYHACCDRLNRRKRYSNEELPERADRVFRSADDRWRNSVGARSGAELVLGAALFVGGPNVRQVVWPAAFAGAG